jgi:hypothetical protein
MRGLILLGQRASPAKAKQVAICAHHQRLNYIKTPPYLPAAPPIVLLSRTRSNANARHSPVVFHFTATPCPIARPTSSQVTPPAHFLLLPCIPASLRSFCYSCHFCRRRSAVVSQLSQTPPPPPQPHHPDPPGRPLGKTCALVLSTAPRPGAQCKRCKPALGSSAAVSTRDTGGLRPPPPPAAGSPPARLGRGTRRVDNGLRTTDCDYRLLPWAGLGGCDLGGVRLALGLGWRAAPPPTHTHGAVRRDPRGQTRQRGSRAFHRSDQGLHHTSITARDVPCSHHAACRLFCPDGSKLQKKSPELQRTRGGLGSPQHLFFSPATPHTASRGVMMSNKQRRREEVLKKLCIRLGFVPGGSGEDVAERVKAGMGWGKYICSSVFLSLTS